MFYQLKPTFEAVQEKPAEGVPWVEVITQEEMDSQVTQHPYLTRSLRHGHSCKAELFGHCAAGALLVPRKEHSPRSGHSFAFLLTADRLTFVDDTGQIEGLLEQLSYQPGLEAAPGELLLEFLEFLIQEDAAFLQHLETQLDKLEEQLLEQEEPQRFENQLHRCRRTLLKLSAYYAQLDELGGHSGRQPQRAVLQKAVPWVRAVLPPGRAAPQPDRLPAGVLPAAAPDLPVQDRLKAEPGDAVSHGGDHGFYAPHPHHRVVWHEFPRYAGAKRPLGLPGRDPGQLGHPPGGGALL